MIKGRYDLDPDGVHIIVDWDRFVPSSSVFVPCINTTECILQCEKIAEQKEWEIDTRVRIENGARGVRIWRVL